MPKQKEASLALPMVAYLHHRVSYILLYPTILYETCVIWGCAKNIRIHLAHLGTGLLRRHNSSLLSNLYLAETWTLREIVGTIQDVQRFYREKLMQRLESSHCSSRSSWGSISFCQCYLIIWFAQVFFLFCDASYCDFGWLTLIYRVSDICTYSQTEQLYAYWRGCLTVNLNEVYIHFWNTSHLLPWIIGSHWVWTVGQSVLGCGWIEIIQTCLVIAYESCAITFLYRNMIAGHHSSL